MKTSDNETEKTSLFEDPVEAMFMFFMIMAVFLMIMATIQSVELEIHISNKPERTIESQVNPVKVETIKTDEKHN